MEWPGIVLLVVLVVVAAYAVWRNMSDGIGNNRISTRNRGISGDRGNDHRDGDLGWRLVPTTRDGAGLLRGGRGVRSSRTTGSSGSRPAP